MKTRTHNYSDDVEKYFKANPNEPIPLAELCREIGLTPEQVHSALSYLRHKHKLGKAVEIRIVERGKSWRYVPYPDTSGNPQVFGKKKTGNTRRLTRSPDLAPSRIHEDEVAVNQPPDWAPDARRHQSVVTDAVPDSEPLVQFRVKGHLVIGAENKGMVLMAASPGFSGHYLLTEL